MQERGADLQMLFFSLFFSHCKLLHLSTIAAMPLSSTTVYRLIIFFTLLQQLLVVESSATLNRRILHQPFSSQVSTPPYPPPSPPLPTSNYPFTTSTPPDTPFFPFYPSSPPPPFPASFPANLSSVVIPYASKSKRASSKLIIASIAAAAVALVFVSIAVFLHFRKKRRKNRDSTDRTKTQTSVCSPRVDYAVSGHPELQRPTQRSSDFLYLGTLVNSHSEIGTDHRQQNLFGDSSGLNSSKNDSPELRPLPLLSRQNVRGNHGNVELRVGGDDNATGSASRRDFSVIELENIIGELCSSSSYSSSKSSASGSPIRSLSRNISPPASLSPNNFSLKSPELVTISDQSAPLKSPPPPPPLVEVKESQSPPSSTSPQRVYSRSKETSPKISNSLDVNLDSSNLITSISRKKVPPPPPPPPPPPLSSKQWGSPRTPIPQVSRLVSGPPVLVAPLRPMSVESPSLISPIQLPNGKALESNGNADDNEDVTKLKLKPLHWDKVKANSDREMVWDQLQSSSFRLNEEMFETLFVAKAPIQTPKEAPRWSILPLPTQGNRILDPKKSQNIAILLKALNVTVDEVCDALVEGNADSLGTELLESLLKMAPSKEEEQKLKEYKDDSPFKLGAAEKFLKAVLDIPFAFKRVEALLHVSNFESEIEYLKNSFQTLEAACEELRNSRMFLKLLEAVLKTGNRMNIGTNRGDAQAFKLDTLLKLVDIKGADGKTTLLHFVVQEIIRSEGARINSTNQNTGSSINDDLKSRKLGLQVVSSLGSELNNVKKAAVMDSEVLHNDVLKLSNGLGNIAEVVCLVETTGQKEKTEFSMSMNKFIRMSEEGMIRILAQESVALSLVKEITEYFHGNSLKEEARPFRIFMVVRDFLKVLDRVCKEVGSMNESSAHKFPVPVNPTLQQTSSGFPGKPSYDSLNDEGW